MNRPDVFVVDIATPERKGAKPTMTTIPEMTEAEHRDWLAANANQVLRELGVAGGHVVLDFGCGPGRYCLPAARLVGPKGRVYAVDKNADQLALVAQEAATHGLANIVTHDTGGGVATPLAEACCDRALLFDVLQLIDDWPALFGEISRVLKAGGRLSVFPMHVRSADVRRHALAAGLAEEPAWRCILNFRK
jgi:ubiquinone/menaquinone biosynthesis C-methylase UbiE